MKPSDAWNRFWYSEPSALNLAMARIIIAAQALWVVLSRDYGGISGLPAVFWSRVPTDAQWRFLAFPGVPDFERVIQWFAVAALVAVLLGVRARTSCFIAGILLYHLAPLEAIIWMRAPFARGLTIPVLGLIVLSFSRCGDRLSILGSRHADIPRTPGLDYAWQLRLVQLFLCQVYLFSAIAKLERSGVGWISADNIRRWILDLTQDPEFNVFRSIGSWMASHPALCFTTAAVAMAIELCFILVLFSKRARLALVPAMFAFHIGIWISMNLTFLSAPLLLIFVDWDTVWRRSKRAIALRTVHSATEASA